MKNLLAIAPLLFCIGCAGMKPVLKPSARLASIKPAASSQTNVNISISGPYTNPDNPGWLTWVLSTTQLSNHVLKIERSTDAGFSWSQSATWDCYFMEQPVGGFFQVPVNDVSAAFYRSVNTECAPMAVARRSLSAKAKSALKAPSPPVWVSGAPKLSKKLAAWRTADGLRLGPELAPQKFGKYEFRRFILVK